MHPQQEHFDIKPILIWCTVWCKRYRASIAVDDVSVIWKFFNLNFRMDANDTPTIAYFVNLLHHRSTKASKTSTSIHTFNGMLRTFEWKLYKVKWDENCRKATRSMLHMQRSVQPTTLMSTFMHFIKCVSHHNIYLRPLRCRQMRAIAVVCAVDIVWKSMFCASYIVHNTNTEQIRLQTARYLHFMQYLTGFIIFWLNVQRFYFFFLLCWRQQR